jgi:hypothetical protein
VLVPPAVSGRKRKGIPALWSRSEFARYATDMSAVREVAAALIYVSYESEADALTCLLVEKYKY